MSIFRRRKPTIDMTVLGPIHPGDVIVLRDIAADDTLKDEMIEAIIAHYRAIAIASGSPITEAAYHCPLLVFLDGDATIESLSEDQMREHGWIRADDWMSDRLTLQDHLSLEQPHPEEIAEEDFLRESGE